MLFRNKYRIETTRLKNFDYSANAFYFITVCTKEKEHFFGKIQNDEMVLNTVGSIVESEWLQTPVVRPDMNLSLDEYVVMPNHFHGILCIGNNEFNSSKDGMNPMPGHKNTFGIQSKNLGAIMRGFKSSVTKKAREMLPYFAWQERFYDHIIRNEKEYFLIRNYIVNNPLNWQKDKFYKS